MLPIRGMTSVQAASSPIGNWYQGDGLLRCVQERASLCDRRVLQPCRERAGPFEKDRPYDGLEVSARFQ